MGGLGHSYLTNHRIIKFVQFAEFVHIQHLLSNLWNISKIKLKRNETDYR